MVGAETLTALPIIYVLKGCLNVLFLKLLKFEIGNFSWTLAKSQHLMEEKIVEEILSLSSIPTDNILDEQRVPLTELQNKLDNIYRTRAQGAFIWSRQKWLEH